MTHKQWMNATVGDSLAEFWGDRFTERQAHLLMLACCRRHEFARKNKTLRAALDAIAAHYADPTAAPLFDGQQFRALYQRVNRVTRRSGEPEHGIAFGVLAAVEPQSIGEELEETTSYLVYSCLHDVISGVDEDEYETEAHAQAVLVREIVGYPFKKPKSKVKPAWRTDTVMTLARQMYRDEEFSAMPILADALQDAGCDNNDILNHCRDSEQPHVRGCWVLDLLFESS